MRRPVATHSLGDDGATVAPSRVLPAGPWGVGRAAPPPAPGSSGTEPMPVLR